jgi:hypothetical protein
MRVSYRWKRVFWILSWVFSAAGIVISFMTLPPLLAGITTVVLTAVPILLRRIGFTISVLHIMPMPSRGVIESRLGSLWDIEDKEGQFRVVFGQLFTTKAMAKDAFRMFRSWNFGRYIDDVGNVHLRVIREELDRYTIILYPGERGVKEMHTKRVKSELGQLASCVVKDVRFFFYSHADYWNRKHMKDAIEKLSKAPSVLLNCFFLVNNKPVPVSQRTIQINRIELIDRKEVKQGEMGYGLEWKDPWSGVERSLREKYQSIFEDKQIEEL